MAYLGTFGQVAQRNLPCVSDYAPEIDDADERDPVAASDEAMAIAGRADRAFQAGDRGAAADLYRSAAEMLLSAAEAVEAL